MEEKQKRKLIKLYFTHALHGTIVGLVCCTILLLAACAFIVAISGDARVLVSYKALYFLALLFLPLPVMTAYIIYVLKHLPVDLQIDLWFREDIEMLSGRAVERLGLKDTKFINAPIAVYKPVYWKASEFHDEDVNKKAGKDSLLRFSAWKFAIFIFTEKRVGCYTVMYNFMKGETIKETTEEYYYTDIVRVGTEQEKIVLADDEEVTIEQFIIKINSGDSLVIRDITKLYETAKNKVIPTPRIDEVIRLARKMLEKEK